MNRLKKISVVTILSIVILISTATVGFANQIVYEKVEEEIISSGVTYKNILRFGQNGWLNLNVMYIDLKDPSIKLDVLTSSGGLSTKETLSTMVNNTENVVGAINGDFFYMLNPDSPLGTIIKDGELISTPVTVHNYATFYIDENNKAFVDYWIHDYWKDELYAVINDDLFIPISAVNKYTDKYQYIMMIDRNWGTHSPGYNDDLEEMVEVLVVDDIVVEIRQNQPPIEIPENGYILLAAKEKSLWAQYDMLISSVNIGDQIVVNKNIVPILKDTKLAFGGGTTLVKDGQVVETFTQNVSGAHPRTAIGITEDRSRLMFVTVDGRHVSYKGLDGKQLAQTLIDLGSYEAIMLDGGGSTTIMKRDLGEFKPKVINHVSDGSERRIINGIAAISTSIDNSLQGIKVEIDNDKSFVGASRKIDVRAFDANYNPLYVDSSLVNLSLKLGEGVLSGMEFIPTQPGQVIIEAEYLGLTSEVTLYVLGEISHMSITPSIVKLKPGQATGFDIIGFDTEGYKAKINSKDVVWNDTQGLGNFIDGVYVAGNQEGSTRLEALFGSAKVTIDTLVGDDETYRDLKPVQINKAEDRLNRPYEIEGEKLFVHSGVQFESYTLLDKIAANKMSSLVNNNYQLSLFTGSLDARISNKINKQIMAAKSGYGSMEQGDSLIIQLDNVKDGIRQTNFDQWPWLQNLVNTTDKKNVFILMSKPIFGPDGFTDKLEANLLMDTFTDLYEKGKQVFVVYEGQNTSVDLINGVRYISPGAYNSKNIKNPQDAFNYIEFNINEEEVTYQIKSLFE